MSLANSISRQFPATALICALAISSILGAWAAHRHTLQYSEYPFGCDSFGYLQMARQIRQSPDALWTADYHLKYEHTTFLSKALRESNLPVERWDESVAPHAHHYFPKADAIGPQYPPGTSLVLAAFPEGKALSGLNVFVIGMLLALGLGLIFLAAFKKAWLAATSISLAALCSLFVVADIGVASYSINAMIVPVVLAIICTYLSTWSGDTGWRPGAFAFAAGAFLGLGMLIRLPILFLAPGLSILLLPRSWRGLRNVIREPLVLFLIGLVCFGVLQVMWHQHRVAGAWHLPTYSGGDTAPPSLKYVVSNTRFYLSQGGAGATGHSLVLVLGLILLATHRSASDRVPGSRRILLAVVVTWLIPTAYFLTHRVTTHYYLFPSTIATLWMMALAFLSFERDSSLEKSGVSRRGRGLVIAVLAALVMFLGSKLYWSAPGDPSPDIDPPTIPQEFREGQPWIWAEMTAGTIVYYADVPAFKVSFGDRETRHLIYTIAFATGKPQYLVVDTPTMGMIADEIRSMGGTLELRGEAAYFPYYLIHWPPSGPGR